MKKFLKMAALMLLAGAFVFGFASCSNDSSDSSSSSATTAAAYKNSDGSKVWNFYSDGSWAAWYKDAVNAGVADGIIKKGTYTIYEGSFTADSGNVNIGISITKEMNQKLAWEDVTNSNSLTGTSGAKTLKDKNGNTWTKQ